MPTPLFSRALVPVMIGALALSMFVLCLAEVATAKSVPAELRVVDSSGVTLAQQTQYTTDARLASDPKALCFGDDSGGSGEPIALPGSTALGQVVHASKVTRSLRPVSVTDAFSFGPGICGIGKAISPSTGFWFLKHDHEMAMVGADQIQVRKRDSILWYLIEDFMQPTPDELAIKVGKANRGTVTVAVRSYADDGTRTLVEGASVSGAPEPTDARGRTTVELTGKVSRIQATREGSIPSPIVPVCNVKPKRCPHGYEAVVGGTSKADRIKGSSAAETILAGAGKDEVRVPRGKSPVRVYCGPGKDVLRIAKSRKAKIKACEKVRRTK